MPREPGTPQMSTAMDPALYEQLRLFAFHHRTTKRAIIEDALREYFAAHAHEGKEA